MNLSVRKSVLALPLPVVNASKSSIFYRRRSAVGVMETIASGFETTVGAAVIGCRRARDEIDVAQARARSVSR